MASNNLGVASGSIQVNTSSLKNADIALRSAGTSMINFGQMAVGAFAAIVGEAAKFEKEMDFVQAVTGASTDQMKQLEKAALDLAKNSVYGPIELSQAFVELVKAGASAQQIIDGVGQASVNLATAADVKIPFAGENLLNIMNTFKIGAEGAIHVSDLLAGAANASSVELQDLVISFKYAGPVAQGLGISIEDLNDALSILGKVGIKGSTAGTSLRAIMLNLTPATAGAEDAMKSLGIITKDGSNLFYDAAGNAKDLGSVFEILKNKTKDLNNEQKVSVLRDIFGVRAIPAALELLSQGEAGFKAINEEINRTTSADVAAKRMDNLDGSIKRLKATLKAIFVEAGGPFQKMLKGWVDGAREFLLWLDKLPGPVKTFIVGAIGIIGVLSIMAGVFLLTIGNIVRMIRVVGEIKNALGLFTGAARIATAANATMSASFLTNPVFLIIAAIVILIGIIVLLYFKVGAVREFIDGLWQKMQAAWDGITKGFVDMYHTIVEKLGKLVDWFSRLPENVGKIASAIGRFFTELPGKIGGGLTAVKDKILGWLSSLAGIVKDQLGKVFGPIGAGLSSAFNGVKDTISKLPGQIAGALGKAASAVGDFVGRLPERIAGALGFIVGRFIRIFFWEIPKAILTGGVKIIRTIIGFLVKIPGFIAEYFGKALSFITSWGPKAAGKMGEIGLKMVTEIISFLVQLPGRIWDILTSITSFLWEKLKEFIALAWEIGSGILNGIIDFIVQLPGLVWDGFLKTLGFIKGLIGDFIQAAWDIGSGIFNAIVDFFISLPGRIVDLLWTAVKKVTSFVGEFFGAAKRLGSSLWNGFKDGLFGSPHTKIEYAMWDMEDNMKDSMRNLGKNMRVLNGMEKRMPQLNAGMVGLPSAASAALTANGGGQIYNQNAPLIGQATIRNDQDIVLLARELDAQKRRNDRARGLVTV